MLSNGQGATFGSREKIADWSLTLAVLKECVKEP
jgi:hypothetical protein